MALIIPYTAQTWTDGVSAASAARLTVIEAGVHEAHFQPAVRVFHNAAQTATTAVALTLAFNSERFDQAGNVADTQHDTVTNNSRLTCRYAGVYQIIASVEWATNAGGSGQTRTVEIRLNAATTIESNVIKSAESAVTVQVVPTIYALAVNDFVEVRVTQNSGGNLNVNSTGNYSPEFMMVRVG